MKEEKRENVVIKNYCDRRKMDIEKLSKEDKKRIQGTLGYKLEHMYYRKELLLESISETMLGKFIVYLYGKIVRFINNKPNKYEKRENEMKIVYGDCRLDRYRDLIKRSKKLSLEMGKCGLTVDELVNNIYSIRDVINKK